MIGMVLAICVLLSGCGEAAVQENTRFSTYLLSCGTSTWYHSAVETFIEQHPEAEMDIDFFQADAYDLQYPREYRDPSAAKLQEYYDAVINGLRTDTAGDLVVGDTLYFDWPGVSPPDWQKMIRSGAFSVVESADPILEFAKQSVSGEAFTEEGWQLVPLTVETLIFYTSAEMAEKWNFDFIDTKDGGAQRADTILIFLEKCAEWVKRYGEDPLAPSVMPDYEYRRLKAVVFDVCGITITDYQNGTVDFDNDTVRRLLEALRTIGTDIEDSGLGDQGLVYFEPEAAKAQRYLFCDGYLFGEEYMSMIPFDVNREYQCEYATRWAAIPAASENRALAVQYLETLMQEEEAYSGHSSVPFLYHDLPQAVRQEKGRDIVIPSGWQYALTELFDAYYAGHMETDEFAAQVQQRLLVYITE